MARLAAYVLLTVLAVVPSLVYRAVSDESVAVDANGAAANDGFYFSLRSVYEVQDVQNCADVRDDDNVVMMDCDEGNGNQLWYIDGTAIKHVNTGKCMEVCVSNCKYFVSNRKEITIEDCSESDAQQFVTIDGSRIRSVQNGNCLDLCNSMTCMPLGDLITYPCSDDTNQQWVLVPGVPPVPSEDVRELVDFAAQVLE